MDSGKALELSVLFGISTAFANTIDNALEAVVSRLVKDGMVELVNPREVSHFVNMSEGIRGIKLTDRGGAYVGRIKYKITG